MMYSTKPVFGILLNSKQVSEKALQLLKKNNWGNTEAKDSKLWLKPIAFFSYDVFEEESENIIRTGDAAVDLENFSFRPEILEYYLKFPMSHVLPELHYDLKKISAPDGAVNSRILSDLAKKENVSETLLKLEKFQIAYFPVFEVMAKSGEKVFFLEISAIDGKILNEKIVPFCEKSFFEKIEENPQSLSSPAAFLNIFLPDFLKELFFNKIFRILVLAIVVLLILTAIKFFR